MASRDFLILHSYCFHSHLFFYIWWTPLSQMGARGSRGLQRGLVMLLLLILHLFYVRQPNLWSWGAAGQQQSRMILLQTSGNAAQK